MTQSYISISETFPRASPELIFTWHFFKPRNLVLSGWEIWTSADHTEKPAFGRLGYGHWATPPIPSSYKCWRWWINPRCDWRLQQFPTPNNTEKEKKTEKRSSNCLMSQKPIVLLIFWALLWQGGFDGRPREKCWACGFEFYLQTGEK